MERRRFSSSRIFRMIITLSATNSSMPYRVMSPYSMVRSAVIKAVIPIVFNAIAILNNSWRIIPVSSNRLKIAPSESIARRFALILLTAFSILAKSAPRSNCPVTSASSEKIGDASTNSHFPSASQLRICHPSEARFLRISFGDSSNVTNTPASSFFTIPAARN